MPDDTLIFTDFVSIKSRPHFDEQCSMTLDNFKSLVGAYQIREQLRCQVDRDGSRCNQEHFNGWLGRRNDDKEALIGVDCANKYFHANEKFRAERRRLSHDIRVDGLVTALRNHLSDKAAITARVDSAVKRLQDIRVVTRDFEQEFPGEVIHRLRDMFKSRNAVILIEVQNREPLKDVKVKITWERRVLTSMAGMGIWEGLQNGFLPTTLAEIKRAIAEAVVSKNQKEAQLRKWRESLDKLPLCEEMLSGIERSLSQFSTDENIALTCLLVKNYERQREVAEFILKRRGNSRPSQTQTQDFVNEVKASVRQQYGGRDFRIA